MQDALLGHGRARAEHREGQVTGVGRGRLREAGRRIMVTWLQPAAALLLMVMVVVVVAVGMQRPGSRPLPAYQCLG